MKNTGIDFETFLSSYNYIAYFECIMYPDGTLEEANPSHTYKLCRIYDESKNIQQIEKEIPLSESPILWLLNKTGCVALWYNNILIDYDNQQFTESQKRNIKELIKRKKICLTENVFE